MPRRASLGAAAFLLTMMGGCFCRVVADRCASSLSCKHGCGTLSTPALPPCSRKSAAGSFVASPFVATTVVVVVVVVAGASRVRTLAWPASRLRRVACVACALSQSRPWIRSPLLPSPRVCVLLLPPPPGPPARTPGALYHAKTVRRKEGGQSGCVRPVPARMASVNVCVCAPRLARPVCP